MSRLEATSAALLETTVCPEIHCGLVPLRLQMDSGGQPGPLTYSPLTEGIQSAAATSLTGRFDAASFSGGGLPVLGEPLQGVVSLPGGRPAHSEQLI